MSCSAIVVRHVPYEGEAAFAGPLAEAGYAVRHHDLPRPLDADFAAADLAIVMGGPMGAYERDAYPWIGAEIEAIAARVAAGRPTLGVCLGAQLIAAALGAEVHAGPVKEVGFAAVALTAAGAASPLDALAGVPLLHWHGDTFALPDGTELLASTAAYRQQAFRRGPTLLALQFHPEMGETDGGFDAWLAGADAYVAQAGTTTDRLREDYACQGPAAAAAGQAMLRHWLAELD